MLFGTTVQAADEPPTGYTIPPSIETHFYDIAITKVPTVVGTPYVTVVEGTRVLSIDWGFHIALTDLATGDSKDLGKLAIPAGARVMDFQFFGEWKSTSAHIPVFLSYALLDTATQCHHLYLRQAAVDRSGQGDNKLGRMWFSSPCFPKKDDLPATLAQSGGRMALIPPAMRNQEKSPEFFLGVGDFRIARPGNIPMTKAARNLLTTIVRISSPQKYSVWARGLRNPQGLVVARLDGKSKLVATSHGPRGGDELVIADQGLDFGWPKVSYGTAYRPNDPADTPDNPGTGQVTSGRISLPLYSWVPSIGASAVTQVTGPAFRRWWGGSTTGNADLLISGMGSRWIYRAVVDGGAVRSFEGLFLGARARSLTQLPNGYLVAGLDAGKELLVLSPTAMWSTTTQAKTR